jgi:hypothetical protein
MDPIQLASFACYSVVSVFCVACGILYLLRRCFMPYHEAAVGVPWTQLDPRLQALLLGLLRATGGGLLTGGLALAVLLAVPFRAGETWPLWALPLVGLATVLPTLYATIYIRVRTGANTPVWLSAAGLALVALGAVLSAI